MSQLELEVARTIYCTIDVDSSTSFMDAVALGTYDSVDRRIGSDLFPPIPSYRQIKRTIEAWILFFKDGVPDTKTILDWFRKHDFHVGEWPELLAFGAQSPKLRLSDHIIALGSTWYDVESECEYALCLHSTENRRGSTRLRCLDLADINIGWTENCGFLVYRERLWKGVG